MHMGRLQYVLLNDLHRVRQDVERDPHGIVPEVGIARGEQGVPDRTAIVDDKQSHSGPAEGKGSKAQSQARACLKEQRPQAEQENNDSNLFLAGQEEQRENKKPECLACIEKIQGKEQKRDGQRLSVKVEIDGVLLGWIKQVEQGEWHPCPGIAQAQAGQPERGKCPA